MQHISLTNALPRSRTDQASGPQDAANTAAVTNGLDVMALQCMYVMVVTSTSNNEVDITQHNIQQTPNTSKSLQITTHKSLHINFT
jgi:hypothetical protein